MGYTHVSMSPTGFSPFLRCAFAVQISDSRYPPNPFGNMSLPKKNCVIALLFTFVVLTHSAASVAQQHETAEIPFLYPDPRTVGVIPYTTQPRAAGSVTPDRVAGISEQERSERILWHQFLLESGITAGHVQPDCPLCVNDPRTPCGTCRMCEAGFICERTLCRHCVQPRSMNMSSACDLTAGDEPCGTCDSCREHRSDPCEHAGSGYGHGGVYNPYREKAFLARIPRPILDFHNNNARKFPVYYNPAPYVRPTFNPAMFQAFARPYVHRWTCALCFRDPCGCNVPGVAGQVSFAFACKFCNRNPCACAAEICNANREMDPIGVATALEVQRAEREGTAVQRAVEIIETQQQAIELFDDRPLNGNGRGGNGGGLFEDTVPIRPDQPTGPRPQLFD